MELYPPNNFAFGFGTLTLGTAHVKSHLRVLLTAWRDSFPHSAKEMKKELAEGNLESWVIKLENRAGALSGE